MNNKWSAVALPSVREAEVRRVLEDEGFDWATSVHVTATSTLAKTIRERGGLAIPIANLIDVLVWSGHAGDLRVEVNEFPSAALFRERGAKAYATALSSWRSQLAGRRARLSLQSDMLLRAFLARHAPDRTAAGVLRGSQRDFRKTIQTLIATDVRPTDFAPADALGRVAVEAWTHIEQRLPELTAIRDDLWISPDEYRTQATGHARALRSRLDETTSTVLGAVDGHVAVIYHGFYFYTAPQWALFQLLRRHDGVDQCFVVQDDGESPVFETWRRFFIERWEMPVPRLVRGTRDETSGGRALLASLAGKKVDEDSLRGSVRVLECHTPAEFVRRWTEDVAKARDEGVAEPSSYAAGAEEIARLLRRLGSASSSSSADLAQLPVGQFLLTLHECITPRVGGRVDLTLSADQLLVIAASGFLDSSKNKSGSPSRNIGALRRAMSFFRGCEALDQWDERANRLYRLVIDEVTTLGESKATQTDLERIAASVRNPLRRAPWSDLSATEAAVLQDTVKRITTLVRQISESETRTIKEHLDFVRRHLERGMENLSESQRREISEKLRGFSAGLDEEMDVEGLVTVVRMLMGREVDFDSMGDEVVDDSRVHELRSLDALGLARSATSIHVANLADGTFPSKVSRIGWPFRPMDLMEGEKGPPSISVEIMHTRVEMAATSDLYLFWLALDGVEAGKEVTLSWISEMGSERRSVSPIVTLITRPTVRSKEVLQRTGGVAVEHLSGNAYVNADRTRPVPRPPSLTDVAMQAELAGLDPQAAASAISCPRRFALQWAMGLSAGFMSEHNHVMLYGNVMGALEKLGLKAAAAARRVCDELWTHLSVGERASSLAKRVIEPGARGPDSTWILTLAGSRHGTDPLSRAYQAASQGRPPSPTVIAPNETEFLPARRATNSDICLHCPVKPRCSRAQRVEE